MSAQEVLTLLSPMVIVLGAAIALARWLWRRFETKLNENRLHYDTKHDMILDELKLIRTQTTSTNGRVSQLEIEQARMDGVQKGQRGI